MRTLFVQHSLLELLEMAERMLSEASGARGCHACARIATAARTDELVVDNGLQTIVSCPAESSARASAMAMIRPRRNPDIHQLRAHNPRTPATPPRALPGPQCCRGKRSCMSTYLTCLVRFLARSGRTTRERSTKAPHTTRCAGKRCITRPVR